mmetsp:Transcript_4072/g.12677  ORF Transcript_4072/g.12677 Transcript_4072/m.12677 type:complete len:215 (-) Transcript_4072:644-1288(-)
MLRSQALASFTQPHSFSSRSSRSCSMSRLRFFAAGSSHVALTSATHRWSSCCRDSTARRTSLANSLTRLRFALRYDRSSGDEHSPVGCLAAARTIHRRADPRRRDRNVTWSATFDRLGFRICRDARLSLSSTGDEPRGRKSSRLAVPRLSRISSCRDASISPAQSAGARTDSSSSLAALVSSFPPLNAATFLAAASQRSSSIFVRAAPLSKAAS